MNKEPVFMPSLTPDGFVELNRTFSNFHEDTVSEQAAFDSYYSDFVDGGTTWKKLLQHPCVVILAEAGSGKTWELKAQTQKYRDAGHTAFFIRLERLAQKPLTDCITGDDKARFDQWLNTNTRGIFFLDAVDEAKLTTHHAFEEALRSFTNGIPKHARKRIRVVVTSRITWWKNQEDQSLLRDLLNLPSEVLSDDGANDLLDDIEDGSEDAKTIPALRVVTLCALGSDQIQVLAANFIPEQTDKFFQALDDDDAWAFARRPQDVIRLANYWRKTNDLGSLTDLLEFDIHSRLQETNEVNDNDLPEALLRSGAEALAAAVVFGKALPISLEADHGDSNQTICVLPSKELPEWTSEQRKNLLSRALFDPAAFGQVRFHHRGVADYLAACWMDHLLANDLAISESINFFFVRSLGREVLIPTRAATACWLACGDNIWNQRIRKKLLDVAPGALLSQGDGGRLDVATRIALLTSVVNKAGAEGEIRDDAANDQLKRLADPELSPLINSLLLDPKTSDDGRIILLRLVREGKIAACVPTALDLARNPDTLNDVLVYAIAAIARAGEQTEKEPLVRELLGRSSLDSRVSYALVTELYPDSLTGEQLVEIARITKNPGDMVAPDFPHGVNQTVINHSPESHVEPLLKGFIHLLEQRPGVQIKNGDISFLISSQYLWFAPVLRGVVDLQAFLSTGAGKANDIIKKMRVVLETHCRSTYPASFKADDNLGGIIKNIRDHGDEHPAWTQLEELIQINDYTSSHHHGEDPIKDDADDQIDQDELTGYVKRTVRSANAMPA